MTDNYCLWPDCPKTVQPNRAFCYRHFARLPERLRGWLVSVFGRDQFQVKGSDAQKAAFACRGWAKSHPDPELPPYRAGEFFTVKDAGLFAADRKCVETCVLNDQSRWLVIATDGTHFDPKDLIRCHEPTKG